MTLKDIQEPVEQHLVLFNEYMKGTLKSNVPLLDLVIKYLTKKKGKQMRPILVLLSAEISGGANKRSYIGAAMVELLHTATLVHDDVVDESDQRRGMASINMAWSNKIAVLVGDFLLGKGLLTSLDNSEFMFLRATSTAVKRMSEGELLQIQKSKEFKSDESIYFRIISDKTASLMASCCEIGALSATDDHQKIDAMRNYGENIGIAFQLRDDIFDLQPTGAIVGKPAGNDLKEKKMTLPLLHALSKASKPESREINKLIKAGKLKKKDITAIIDFIRSHGGIEYAERKAEEYIAKALDQLRIFDDSPAKESLSSLAKFVLLREK